MKRLGILMWLGMSAWDGAPARAAATLSWMGRESSRSVRRGSLTTLASLPVGKSSNGRWSGQLDFMNTLNNVSLTVRNPHGAHFSEAGVSVRLYKVLFTISDARFLAGVGPTLLGSGGVSTESPRRPYLAFDASPVLRMIYAPFDAWGLMLESGADVRFLRAYQDIRRHPELRHRDSKIQTSLYVAAGLSLAVD